MADLIFLGAMTGVLAGIIGLAEGVPRIRRKLVKSPRPVDARAIRVHGVVDALTPIRSPIDGAHGVVAFTRIAASHKGLFRGDRRA